MADLQTEVEVPPFFLCPISLEIMKDPVTLSTGITYDHDTIENWLFSRKNNICPVTKQVVNDIELTPNHTLRRLIQSWCTLNASSGIERFPTPRPPISKTEIIKLLKDSNSPHHQINSLKRLKSIVSVNEMNKRLMEFVGAADYLSRIIINNVDNISMTPSSPAEEAICILYHIKLSPTGLKTLLGKTGEFVDSLTHVMQRASSYESGAYAVMLLKSMYDVAEPMQMTSLNVKFFMQFVNVTKNLTFNASEKATRAALKLLIGVCPWGRNRIKAVEAGVVTVLIDMLLDCSEKRVCEMIIMVLVQTSQCADGRAELLRHGGGLAVVSKMVFGVSPVASERAVRILYSVAMFSGNARVLQEMVELGVVEKLMLVMQVDCGRKMKEKAREILKVHSRVWKKSSRVTSDFSWEETKEYNER